jgi:type VII secretion-associated serine protease mycosin
VNRPPARRVGAATAALGLTCASLLAAAAPARADEIRDREWPLAFLNLPAANQLSTGSGVTVGLLDSGVMGQRVDLTGQVTNGPDYAGGIEQPGQTGWGEHGTCMASIIAGHGRGGPNGMLGAAPGAHVLSVRVIRDDDAPDIGGATKDLTPISDGIKYAVDHGVRVISMSLGGSDSGGASDSTPEADAIRYALDRNVVVVVAAGNSGDKGDAIQFPGAERGVITVAAIDSSGRHAAFSTTGWDVAVSAPGVNLPCDAADSDDEYMLGDGTSQATAYVAGIAALVVAKNPGLSPAQVRDILEQTARNKPAGGRNDQYGFGIVDPVAALKAAAATKGAGETPVAGAGAVAAHFGYGPTQVVTEPAGSFGPMPRAIVGGVIILLAALLIVAQNLRRSRRKSAEAIAAQFNGSATTVIPVVPGWPPTEQTFVQPPLFQAPPVPQSVQQQVQQPMQPQPVQPQPVQPQPMQPQARPAPVQQQPAAEPPSWPPQPGG